MPYQPFGDIWTKFSEYEIRNGFIRPVAGSSLITYQPWDAYRPAEGKESRKQPYHSLLDTLASFQSEISCPSDRFRKAILEHCSQHGLLGILPHQIETIVLPSSGGWKTTYIRAAGGWRKTETVEREESSVSPGAFMRREPGDFEMYFVPLELLTRQFFPDLVPTDTWANFPRPLSEAFWMQYAEPLDLFLSAASRFRQALEVVRSRPRRRGAEASAEFENGAWKLSALLAPVRETIYLDRAGKLATGWVSHSLLAAFAKMATLDLGQTRLLRCARSDCGIYFVTKAKKAKYCTEKCRNTVQMRKYRTNLRKKELKKNGRTNRSTR